MSIVRKTMIFYTENGIEKMRIEVRIFGLLVLTKYYEK